MIDDILSAPTTTTLRAVPLAMNARRRSANREARAGRLHVNEPISRMPTMSQIRLRDGMHVRRGRGADQQIDFFRLVPVFSRSPRNRFRRHMRVPSPRPSDMALLDAVRSVIQASLVLTNRPVPHWSADPAAHTVDGVMAARAGMVKANFRACTKRHRMTGKLRLGWPRLLPWP